MARAVVSGQPAAFPHKTAQAGANIRIGEDLPTVLFRNTASNLRSACVLEICEIVAEHSSYAPVAFANSSIAMFAAGMERWPPDVPP
jgi:hypothetical protein